jgi:hypothetical protein
MHENSSTIFHGAESGGFVGVFAGFTHKQRMRTMGILSRNPA